jgi:hypothetical protein
MLVLPVRRSRPCLAFTHLNSCCSCTYRSPGFSVASPSTLSVLRGLARISSPARYVGEASRSLGSFHSKERWTVAYASP